MTQKIVGNSDQFTAEQRLLNAVTFTSTLLVVFTTALDSVLEGIIPQPFIISLIVTLAFGGIYYRSRFLKKDKWNIAILIVIAIFALNYFWFYLSGPVGIIPLGMVIAVAFFVSISNRKNTTLIISLVSIDVIALHLFSYFNPESIIKSHTNFANSIELTLFNVFSLVLTAMLITYFKINFEKEKEVIEIQNSELAASEEELKQTSEELKSINDHLQEARNKAELSTIAKADFLSTMSHEIRTPLNAIIASSHFLQQKNNVSQEDKEKVEIISFASEQLLFLINDILDFSKIEANELEIQFSDFNLKTFLEQIITSFKEKSQTNNVDLRFSFDNKINDHVSFDKIRLAQIITNLVDNAIKFSNEGSVELKIDLTSVKEETQNLTFQIIDTGIGIKEEDRDSIFESFKQAEGSSTRQFGGTGLGLSITKKLLSLLGSKIILNSEFGVGTTFSFNLNMNFHRPIIDKATQKPPTDENQSLQNKKVLIVDDNLLNLKVTEMILGGWGMEVTTTLSAQEAIEVLKKNLPDLILMDLQMPVLDGYQATQLIRETFPELKKIPIIALTASATREVKEKATKAGLDNFVTKPFIPEKLKDVLLSHI